MGIGRGTDLIFYSSFILFMFLFIKLYSKIERLESKLTEFIQKEALNKFCDNYLETDTQFKTYCTEKNIPMESETE